MAGLYEIRQRPEMKFTIGDQVRFGALEWLVASLVDQQEVGSQVVHRLPAQAVDLVRAT